jgi:phosphatidate cytidylyltransferase
MAVYLRMWGKNKIMLKRVLAAVVLAVVGIPAIIMGGPFYYFLIALILGLAAWEFHHIFCAVDCYASQPVLIISVVAIVLARAFFPNLALAVLTFSILAAMTWHLIDYERGRDKASTDFAFTTTGIVYIGWIGAYLIDIRNLSYGLWWLLLVFPAVWLADTSAFFVGSRWGKHKLSPRLSPKKTWEGYLAGVFFGTFGTAGLSILWSKFFGFPVAWWEGAFLGFLLSVMTTLGDLGESMFKRQAGVKDSSNIIPGHGGVLDRIDSWLWGAALGYFAIIWFFLK